ncbi:MAG: single-stranded DNA-binding protein [Firmicutes bacterium]|nr:single-stranded DNA-binding protein [Clostridia bacterium]MBQ8589707.1 single-stranded DNA-binding protein [Bacillota bacterium]
MANFNFNKVILGGRLTADPELKTTPSGISVTSFTVAVNRRFGGKNGEEPQADFFNVTAWRQTAEFITRYFRKASSICVMGSLQTRSWIDQNGQKRFATEIVADEAYFVDAKSESPIAVQQAAAMMQQGSQAPSYVPDGYGSFGGMPQAGAYQTQSTPKFEELSGDDELPF